MTRTTWECTVTALVDESAPDYAWDDVPDGDWDAAWIKRQSAEEFAAELLALAAAAVDLDGCGVPYVPPPEAHTLRVNQRLTDHGWEDV